jgi:hypothetical protein
LWWEASLRDQCRRDSPKLKRRDHPVSLPSVLDLVEAQFVGHGDATAMGIGGPFGVKILSTFANQIPLP